MSDLYFAQVESMKGKRIVLRVWITHPDAESFPEDATFAHLLLADSLLELSEAKAARAPLRKVVPSGRGMDGAEVVAKVVASVRVRDVVRMPDDLAEMSSWNSKRWRKRDALPAATYDVTVTDAALLSHLAVGAKWLSYAYSSEHVFEGGDLDQDDVEIPPPDDEPEPLLLGERNVFVITPRELYRAEWSGIAKKKKLDAKWADVPFIFAAASTVVDRFEEVHPESPMTKADEKALVLVQLALTDKLMPMFGRPLVKHAESFATHLRLTADEVRRFYSSIGIENLTLR